MKRKYYPCIPIVGIFLIFLKSEGLNYPDIFVLGAFIQAISITGIILAFTGF